MGIVPFNLIKEFAMYAFFSIKSYEFVRDNKLTLAQALKAGHVEFVDKKLCYSWIREGEVKICIWGIPF